jgi:hypothetical protein
LAVAIEVAGRAGRAGREGLRVEAHGVHRGAFQLDGISTRVLASRPERRSTSQSSSRTPE